MQKFDDNKVYISQLYIGILYLRKDKKLLDLISYLSSQVDDISVSTDRPFMTPDISILLTMVGESTSNNLMMFGCLRCLDVCYVQEVKN